MGDLVTVVMAQMTFLPSEGELIEVPLTYTGTLLDYNRQYLILMDQEQSTVTVSRAHLVSIECQSQISAIMNDPSRPKNGAMS